MSVAVMIAWVVAVQLALHYFRWREALQGHELPRPVAYVLGVSGMMVPFTVWLLEQGYRDVAGVMWMVIVSAGLAVVVLGYGVDWIINLVWKVREARQREHALRDMVNDKTQGTD